MADSMVKPEIKFDPAEEGKQLADIEEFEDVNDLRFPGEHEQAWLVKLPSDMWKIWSQMYADQPEDDMIVIGKMRVRTWTDDKGVDQQDVKVRLDDAVPQHKDLPKKYSLEMKAQTYSNTVVFSEKDLPGHRPKNHRNRNLNKPTGVPQKSERYGDRSGYKSAIPKQTALAPLIINELNAVPVQDEEYYDYLAKRWAQSARPKAAVVFHEGIDRAMHPGISNFTSFSTSSKVKAANKKEPPKEKAVRIDRDALLDALMRCFRRYRYCSLNYLRNELKQPESYIKEMLDEVAVLVKSGDFARNWQLKPHYQAIAEAQEGDGDVKEEVARMESGTDMGTGDEMDASDFEDVKMEGAK